MLEPQYALNGSCLRWFEFGDIPAFLVGSKRTVLGEVEVSLRLYENLKLFLRSLLFSKDVIILSFDVLSYKFYNYIYFTVMG